MIGKTLGHYQITSQIGKGGMGEVYQATDQKLGRDVAIKVLPEEFARDADRVARFHREAKLLASLNHPNIAAIYGLEESGGSNFIVLELVEGETLADRIKTGPIPVEESLKLALQIAEALEAAHEKGVIHRDLKPANIKVTPGGKVKVLDFGLAKAFAGEQPEVNLSHSPTLSDMATIQGVILGTAAYMPPEQAKGKTVDKRADIWAFGVVLSEMLTGQQLFMGETVSETLAAVLMREPDWKRLPPNLHPRIRFLLERCLKKEPKDRCSSISDGRVDIQDAVADPSGLFVQPVMTVEPRRKLRTILPWAAAALVLGLAIAGVVVWELKLPETSQVVRFDYLLPADQQYPMWSVSHSINISADGKQIVYSTPKGLCRRPLDELNAKPIPGSDMRSEHPFFSPDGKSIVYFSPNDRKLKKIAIGGGAPAVLCGVEDFSGGSWHKDGFIVYGTGQSGIKRIPDEGGTPENLVEGKSEVIFDPQILPDGTSVLYTVGINQPRIMVKPLKLIEAKQLFAGRFLRYLPSGHIIYWDPEGNLCAVQFDLDRHEAIGKHVLMLQGADNAAISDSGTLIYTLQATPAGGHKRALVWVDKEGKEERLKAQPDEYDSPKISPDGKRIALVVGIFGKNDIVIWDIERENMSKLTLDKTDEFQPIWTRDSQRIIYYSTHEDETQGGIYWRAAHGSGKIEKLMSASDRRLMPWSLSGDGKILLMQELVSWTNADIGWLSMENKPERKPLLQSKFSEAQPTISSDGRWMAYVSSESTEGAAQDELYICPFPEVDKARVTVSTGGGYCPLWSPDSKTLFYLSQDNLVMWVSVNAEPVLSVGIPKSLFKSTNLGFIMGEGYPWDIDPDGKRFLMIKDVTPPGKPAEVPRKITVVVNWTEELKQRVPVK